MWCKAQSLKKYKATKELPFTKNNSSKITNDFIERNDTGLIQKLTTTNGQEVKLVYSDKQKAVSAYVIGNDSQLKLIQPIYMLGRTKSDK